jgi:hypothetical protein
MKNHKIYFKDGKIEFITKKEYDFIWKESTKGGSDMFNLGRSRYRFSDIKKLEEPVSQYPAFDPIKFMGNRTPEARLKAISSMAKGIKKCIPSEYGKPEKILQLMRLRYSQLKTSIDKNE